MNYRTNMVVAIAILLAGCSPASSEAATLTTVRVASGLQAPLFVTAPVGDFDRLFIVEQGGRIKILKGGVVLAQAFLNIASIVSNGGEQGLLGLAFHPNYASNGFFYVNYTDNFGDTVVARYSVSGDPDLADSGSATVLLTISEPFANHNGGWMAFGPSDGYLYISTGDGGSGGDPGNRAQDIEEMLLGKILRLDVDGAVPYAIPPDNPFVGIAGDDEIWSYGLRNPWRVSFDRLTGDMYMGDVGQANWEEVDFQPAASIGGENYGWRCYEGSHTFNTTGCPEAETMVFPIHEYVQAFDRCSITGGYVYRGCAIPDIEGIYFFADYCTGEIWSFRYDGVSMTEFQDRTTELIPDLGTIAEITSFGEDAAGEIYIVDGSFANGEVFKIVSAGSPANDCNANEIEDACEILDGSGVDANEDGILDECVVDVPAISEWGMLAMMLLILTAGSVACTKRRHGCS